MKDSNILTYLHDSRLICAGEPPFGQERLAPPWYTGKCQPRHEIPEPIIRGPNGKPRGVCIASQGPFYDRLLNLPTAQFESYSKELLTRLSDLMRVEGIVGPSERMHLGTDESPFYFEPADGRKFRHRVTEELYILQRILSSRFPGESIRLADLIPHNGVPFC